MFQKILNRSRHSSPPTIVAKTLTPKANTSSSATTGNEHLSNHRRQLSPAIVQRLDLDKLQELIPQEENLDQNFVNDQ